MENNTQTNTNKKSNPAILIGLIVLIIAIVGYGVWQSTNKKDNQQKEATTVSTTAETTTETTTESTTVSTTESTTKKREADNEMLEFLSHSQWDNSFDNSLFISNGTIEYTDSNDNLKDTLLLSIYTREDSKYDVEITYKDGKTETYIMSTDFSYDGEFLHYDCYTYQSFITLQGNGELSGKWMFKGYFG